MESFSVNLKEIKMDNLISGKTGNVSSSGVKDTVYQSVETENMNLSAKDGLFDGDIVEEIKDFFSGSDSEKNWVLVY